jgi:DNA-binding transcriptional MocR family regulator
VQLPSAREISDRYGVRLTAAQHALTSLAEGGFIEVHQGRRSVVCDGLAVTTLVPSLPVRHDCPRSMCRPHVCKPMAALTIRQIHAILLT